MEHQPTSCKSDCRSLCSTGLDSAATFDIISTQRRIAKGFSKTVVISLLQPSPEVFALFDDVVILNEGHIVYHGPRQEALGYFESLGFKCPHPEMSLISCSISAPTSRRSTKQI